ncbi:MAG: hypothetical protein WDN66_01055 [Candidatus Saccharibacteria bacterium]
MTGWDVDDTIGIDVNTVVKLADDKGNIYSGPTYPFIKVFSSGQSVRDNSTFLVTRENDRLICQSKHIPA